MAPKKGNQVVSQKDYDHLYKIVLVGDSDTGKSLLLSRWTNKNFDLKANNLVTIGVDFKIRRDNVGGQRIKTQIWDTPGHGRAKVISSSYCRGAKGIFFVFDPNNRRTFANVSSWMANVREHTSRDAILMLLANEYSDKPPHKVTTEEQQALADHVHLFMEVSTLHDVNLEEAYLTMLNAVHERNLPKQADQIHETFVSMMETDEENNVEKRKCVLL